MTDVYQHDTRWRPQPRPEWVEQVNAEGRAMDIKSVVPLDKNSLLEHARANTGLTDFGDDNWHEPFEVLVKSLDEEANLNLMGRLMTRMDMLNCLEQRLKIEDTYKRHPEINDVEVASPLVVVGQGRSGTSVLQNLLAQDPDNNSLLHWSAYAPCPPPETGSYANDPRIEWTHPRITQISRVTPELESTHEFSAMLPIESPHIHAFSFRSAIYFTGYSGGNIPGYAEYMSTQDGTLPFEYEKRILKLLQWKNPCRNWVFKSPALLLEFRDYFKVFPDANLVWIHRDPVKALSSMVSHIGNLFWSHTDTPNFGEAFQPFVNAEAGAHMLSAPIEMLESGSIPKKTLCNVQYQDFMQDPVNVAEVIYRYFGIEMTQAARQAMSNYMRDNPRSSRPKHSYQLGDAEQIRAEREAYRRYQTYFNVPNEI